MGKKANPKIIGAFVLGAIALAVIAVAVLGSGKLFQKGHQYVLFFKGDVSGLRVGAPVKFKGVRVGTVKRIRLSFYNPGAGGIESASDVRIPVIIELEPTRIVMMGRVVQFDDPKTIHQLVSIGLRGQLRIESLVTGMLYVALDIQPQTPAHLILPPNSRFHEIPTEPTPFEEAQTMATSVIDKLNAIDIEKVIRSTTETLEAIRGIATSPQLKLAIDSIGPAAKSLDSSALAMKKAAADLDREIGPLAQSLKTTSSRTGVTLEQTEATLKQGQAAFSDIQTVLAPNSPLNYQLLVTLKDVSAAARSIRELTDYLQRNPSAIVRGKDVSDIRP